MDQEINKMLGEKAKIYGDPIIFHKNLGVTWSGLLSHHYGFPIAPIPPHVVANMMFTFKALRAVHTPFHHKDSYDDIRGYITIAEGAHRHYDAKKSRENLQDRGDSSSELRDREPQEGSGGEGRHIFVGMDTTELPERKF